MVDTAFDAWVAKFYINKVKKCAEKGCSFELSLLAVHNLLRAKRCYFTGIELTRPPLDELGYAPKGYERKNTDVTLDRIDNSKGYIQGNVKACSLYANSLKAVFECPSNVYKFEHFTRMAKVLEKHIQGGDI